MRTLMLAAALALVGGVLGALGYDSFSGGKSQSSDDHKQASSGSPSKGGGSEKGKFRSGGSSTKSKGSDEEETASALHEGNTIPGFTTAQDADALSKQIGDLAQRLDALQARLNAMERSSEPMPPDLHTLQVKMGELSRTIDDVARLPSRVHRIGTDLEALEQQVKMTRDRLTAIEDQDQTGPAPHDSTPGVVPDSAPATPRVSATDRAEEIDAPVAALDQAVALFKLGQYPVAASILARLRTTQPDDARVWYYSALVRGLTNGQWEGEARTFAEKGVDCERAGTPPRPMIEQAVRGLTRPQGGEWLAGYRARVTRKL
jgi:hypothetical protein